MKALIDITNYIGMSGAIIMGTFFTIGLPISFFTIKETDKIFTGENNSSRMWFPTCIWGMSSYAWDLAFKKDSLNQKYQTLNSNIEESPKKFIFIKYILLCIYLPANLGLCVMISAYAAKYFFGLFL
ncbi:hypothetical protein [Larsenimonas suaedae]|uniref:Uncharacterized protein n=1 Tax=Larsenimonas suaedae TaxID=1851019 RepID=A0ABU1GWB7_9GAMM|nr:hypothetical protein [Larsenimonas suaedae]MCM2973453.1 hypothetical protein [Larsenimonas suaedae]MDR5896347.1 hypothetical protein [Larsenimonas suaedae]